MNESAEATVAGDQTEFLEAMRVAPQQDLTEQEHFGNIAEILADKAKILQGLSVEIFADVLDKFSWQ